MQFSCDWGLKTGVTLLTIQLNCFSTHQVLSELKKSNFTLLNDRIEFDENGDPLHKFYSIVFWSHRGEAEEVGIYKFNPYPHFSINNSKIMWHSNNKVSFFLIIIK